MSFYLSALLIVVAGLAMTQAASRCCVPSQWECGISEAGGVHVVGRKSASLLLNAIQYSYDAKNKRTAMTITTNFSETAFNTKVIQDYRAKRQYTIVGAKCRYVKLTTAFMPACVPANATYLGRYNMGVGKSKITLDSWQMSLQQLRVFFSLSTDGNCIPISELIYGQVGKVQEVVALGYINPSLGIHDPRVFVPPPGCRPARNKDTLVFEMENAVTSKLSKYFSMTQLFK